MNNREIRSITSEIRAETKDSARQLVGSIPFNSVTDIGPFFEQIDPHAFDSALQPGAEILCLRDHKPELLIARSTAGSLTFEHTPSALIFTATLNNSETANTLYEDVRTRLITGTSFGMLVDAEAWDQSTKTRTITAATLYEVSFVSFPFYTESKATLRSSYSFLKDNNAVETSRARVRVARSY